MPEESTLNRLPTLPRYVCHQVEIRRLVGAGLFDGEGKRGYVTIADPRDISRDERVPTEVRIVDPGKAAVVVLDGQAVEATGRPGFHGTTFWTLRCRCGRACRTVFRPICSEFWACRKCWNIARPSRSPRWKGVRPQDLAKALEREISDLEACRP